MAKSSGNRDRRKPDPLMDRACVLLDGHCDCWLPWKDCKYLDNNEEETKEQV